jgi:hypothetical protein
MTILKTDPLKCSLLQNISQPKPAQLLLSQNIPQITRTQLLLSRNRQTDWQTNSTIIMTNDPQAVHDCFYRKFEKPKTLMYNHDTVFFKQNLNILDYNVHTVLFTWTHSTITIILYTSTDTIQICLQLCWNMKRYCITTRYDSFSSVSEISEWQLYTSIAFGICQVPLLLQGMFVGTTFLEAKADIIT